MIPNKWVVRLADNVFMRGGPYDPEVGSGELLVILPDERMPDRERERYDPNQPEKRRQATPNEIRILSSTSRSRDKDVLAIIAFLIRSRNVAAWNALPLNQKRVTLLAEADQWRDIRVWIEDNF